MPMLRFDTTKSSELELEAVFAVLLALRRDSTLLLQITVALKLRTPDIADTFLKLKLCSCDWLNTWVPCEGATCPTCPGCFGAVPPMSLVGFGAMMRVCVFIASCHLPCCDVKLNLNPQPLTVFRRWGSTGLPTAATSCLHAVVSWA